MFIQIDEKYALETDSDCWMIQKRVKVNKWCPKGWKSFAYHHTFKSALESLARRKVRLSGAQNLEDAIKDAQKVGEELSAIFDKSFEK
jgi:hypothetical protein